MTVFLKTSLFSIAGGSLLYGTGLYKEIPYVNEIKNYPIGAVRFGRAFATVSNIVIDYKKHLRCISEDDPLYENLKSQIHSRSAKKLLDLCCANGGAFVKIGQHLGSLEYLLPEEYVNTLKILHNNAPRSIIEDVRYVISEELNADPSEIFVKFDEEPVGTASLAQVHIAETRDGKKVAVKVQHKNVRELANIDVKGMEILVRIVSKLFSNFDFEWLVKETKRNLPLELNFMHEAKNAEKAAKMFNHLSWLKIPKIDWNLTTSRILTMEFCEGGQVNNLEYLKRENISAEKVSDRLSHLYSEMIFKNGFVHSDPHPGNVLVNKLSNGDPQIILLDHGLYAELEGMFRCNYTQLWLGLLSSDVDKIIQHCKKMNVGDMADLLACMIAARSWDSISTGISKKQMDASEKAEIAIYAGKLIPQIVQTLAKVNRQMLLILKTNDLIRGIESSLKIQKSERSFLTMARVCVESEYEADKESCNGNIICRLGMSFRFGRRLVRLEAYRAFLNIKYYFRAFLTALGL